MTLNPRERNKRHSLKNPPKKLSWGFPHHNLSRWLPRHGEPQFVEEWISQHLIKAIAWLPVYIAIVVTVILVLQIYVLSGLF